MYPERKSSLCICTQTHTYNTIYIIKNAVIVQLVIVTVPYHLCALLIYNEDLLQRNWCLHKNSGCITLLLIPYRLSPLTHVNESIMSVLVFQSLCRSHPTHTSSPSTLSSSDHFAVRRKFCCEESEW